MICSAEEIAQALDAATWLGFGSGVVVMLIPFTLFVFADRLLVMRGMNRRP